MAVVSTMILRSMRMIGEKERGDTLDANEQVECLAELNTMIESWSINRLLCYAITEDTHVLTASTLSYTIGPGATINTTRPTRLVDPCFVRDSSGGDTPVRIVNLESYGAIVTKTAGFTYPTYVYYDAEYSATSTGTIFLYPSPQGGLTLHINSWKQLQSFADLSTTVLMPPGYQLAIESNFAVHLAAGFVPIPGETAKIASDSKAAIMDINIPAPISRTDLSAQMGVGRNIYTGP